MIAFSYYSVPPFLSGMAILLAGLWFFLRSPWEKVRRAYLYCCVTMAFWLLCYSVVNSAADQATAVRWMRAANFGIIFIPLANLNLNFSILGQRATLGRMLAFGTLGVVFLALSYTPLTYSGVHRYFWGHYFIAGPIHPVFLLYFTSVWVYGIYLLYKRLQVSRAAGDIARYNLIKSILVGWAICMLAMVDYLPKYGFPIYPIGCYIVPYWLGITAVGLSYDRLSTRAADLTRKVLIGSVNFFILTTVVTVGYLGTRSVWRGGHEFQTFVFLSAGSALAGMGLVLVFRWVKRAVDGLLFPEFHDRERKLMRLNQKILDAASHQQFNTLVLEHLCTSFAITRASLLLWVENENAFKLQANRGWDRNEGQGGGVMTDGRYLTAYLAQVDSFPVRPALAESTEAAAQAAHLLERFGAQLIVPIKKGDGSLLGLLLLGEKVSGLSYTTQDIDGLRGFADLAAVVARMEQVLSVQRELERLVDIRTRELKSAQEDLIRQERLAAMGEIASVVGHEIRNALTAISHSSYVLESKLSGPAGQKYLSAINAQVAASQKIIGDILTYVRNREPVLAPARLEDLAREVFQAEYLPKNVRLRLELAPGLPPLMLDKEEIRRALINLFHNAVEAMPAGGTLGVAAAAEAGGARLSVSDTGCGMSAEQMAKIFTPLFTTKPHGTGLGLMVVKKAMELHGGRIEVESRVGNGTTFSVFLPAYAISQVAVPSLEAEALNGA